MGTIVTNTGIETANRKTVKEILGSKFIVPEYQRPYSWTETEVLQLLEDIWQHFIRSHNDKNKSDKTVHEMYFLGSILTAKDTTEDGRLCLVDGQQRITTLLCVVSALADVIRSNQKTENENKVWAKIPVDILDKLLADRDYNGVPTPRISYNREAIDNFFKNFIADNSNVKINKHGEKPDHEVKLLSQAYTTAKDFLNDKLKAELVVDFLEFFDNKIQVVLIEVASMQYAVLAYETMNSRGLPLTALEQLKGVLFRSFAGTELLLYEEAVKVWQQIFKRFYAINEASSQWVPIRGEHSVSSDKKILGAFISVYEAISPGQFNVKTLMSPGTPELSKWVIKEHEFTGTGRKEAKAAKEALGTYLSLKRWT